MSERDAAVEAVYQELLLDHFRRPRKHGALDDPAVTVDKLNPLCGDTVTLQLAFDGDTIAAVRHQGSGCAISRASTSMMAQLLEGRTLDDAAALRARVRAMLTGDPDAASDKSLGDLRALAGVSRLPQRVKCALLPWSALEEALKRRDQGA